MMEIGRYGNALVDDGDAKLALDLLPHRHQVLGLAADFFLDALPGGNLRRPWRSREAKCPW